MVAKSGIPDTTGRQIFIPDICFCSTEMVTPEQRWRAAREAAGFSMDAAARAAGVAKGNIQKLERGDPGVTLRMAHLIAATYGVTFAQIYRDENEPERIPAYLVPLAVELLPLDMNSRVAIVKNLASSLGYMATLYAGVAVSSVTEASDVSKSSGHVSWSPNDSDALSDVVPYLAETENDATPTGLRRLPDQKKERARHRKHE